MKKYLLMLVSICVMLMIFMACGQKAETSQDSGRGR